LLAYEKTSIVTELQYVDLHHGGSEGFKNIKIDVGQGSLTTVLGDLTAQGHIVRAISNASRDKEIIAPLTFPSALIINPPGIDAYPAVVGTLFSDTSESSAVIANLCDQPQEIDTSVLGPVGTTATLITADHFYTFVVDDSDLVYSNFTMGSTIVLPPFSLCTISGLDKSLATGGMEFTPKFDGTHIAVYASDELTHTNDLLQYVTDQNGGETLSFSLTGVNPTWISDSGVNGLEFAGSVPGLGTYEAYVRVEDSAGLTDYATLDVMVIDGSLYSDADALSNNEEVLLGTNPFLEDTDGDGYSDSVDLYPLDPAQSEFGPPPATNITIVAGPTLMGDDSVTGDTTFSSITVQAGDMVVIATAPNKSADSNLLTLQWDGVEGVDGTTKTVQPADLDGRTSYLFYTQIANSGTYIFTVDATVSGLTANSALYVLRAGSGVIAVAAEKMLSGNVADPGLFYNFSPDYVARGIAIESIATKNTVVLAPDENYTEVKNVNGRFIAHSEFVMGSSWNKTHTGSGSALDYVGAGAVFIEISVNSTPESLWVDWLMDFALGANTNSADHADNDGYNNLYEYAFGGDPTNALSIGYSPEFQSLEDSGTNYIEYVYARRSDAEERGLGYALQTTDDLVGGVWTNSGVVFVGEGVLSGEFDSVTNRLPATDAEGFIRLNVEYAP
jgi:hypothetical protein